MADHHDASSDHYVRGEMDIHQHQHSYELFASLTKWCSLYLAIGLVFLVVLTCTKLGLISAFLLALIVGVVGFFMLKNKAGSSH